MIHTIASLREDAKKVAGRASPNRWDKTARVQYIRMEGGLVRRTKLRRALSVLKDRTDLFIYVDHTPPPARLVFEWLQGTLRLRLWHDEELDNWKAV